ILTVEQLEQALAEQRASGGKLGAVLQRLGLIDDDQLVALLARQYSVAAIQLTQLDIDTEVLKLVPAQIARKYEVLPIRKEGTRPPPAMTDPPNVMALDDAEFMPALQVVPVVASRAAIRAAIERCYEPQATGLAGVLEELTAATTDVEVVEGEEDTWAKLDI